MYFGNYHGSFIVILCFLFFFFNDTATTEIYTLSLHDALPIWNCKGAALLLACRTSKPRPHPRHSNQIAPGDRKSTRLNSSHSQISYAVFCLKKKTTFFIVLLLLPPTPTHTPAPSVVPLPGSHD